MTKTVLVVFSISRPKRLHVFHSIRHGTWKRGNGIGVSRQANDGKTSCASGGHLPGIWPLNEPSFQFYGLLKLFPDTAPAVPVQGISHRCPFMVNISRSFPDKGPGGIPGRVWPLLEGPFSAGN